MLASAMRDQWCGGRCVESNGYGTWDYFEMLSESIIGKVQGGVSHGCFASVVGDTGKCTRYGMEETLQQLKHDASHEEKWRHVLKV